MTKILLVDDKRENLLALEELLETPDVEILTATSGDDALSLILKHDFALALLDVQMPGMNGFELAGLMRSVDRSRGIPIIFVTASQMAEAEVFQGYGNGAVDYLAKPLNAQIVRSKVRVFIELAQKSAALTGKLAEVEHLRDAAEAANEAKSRFLANMSHEIRTPLAAVLGYADLLHEYDDQPEERQACLEAIRRNGSLLLKLVDDVLDLAKIEAEKVEIEVAPVPMASLLADLDAVHRPHARGKGLSLDILANGHLPRVAMTDTLRLQQALNNVISNAVKFTARGSVSVTISSEPTPSGRMRVSFAVKDSGLGISSQQAARLFKPFMQADSSTTRKFGGTGLGLGIAKRLARLLGGDVMLLASGKDEGSTFVITVDAGPAATAEMVEGATLLAQYNETIPYPRAGSGLPRLDGAKVLVVDDMPDNRKLMRRALSLSGATVDEAENGAAAIETALATPFDVILMDIQMPITDGYEATSSLRAAGYTGAIIALTAHALKDELDRCMQAGCDGYQSKPVNLKVLVEQISFYVARARA